MSAADWSFLTGILSAPNAARGVTSGPAKPTGGGTFVYGINTLTNTPGGVALYASPQAPNTNFAPLSSGGDVSAAMNRAPGGGLTGWDAFVFIGLGGTALTDEGYLLGLSDGDPCHVELRKGSLALGLPDEAPNPTGINKILRRSTEVVVVGTWMHLKLEMVANANGDVILNCYKNLGNVTTPVWVAIAGMDSFTDDALGVATGELPYTSGRVGFGATFSDVTRRSYFDQIVVSKQV